MNKFATQSPLGRLLDFRYRSNALIAVFAATVALLATFYNAIAAERLASPGWVVGGAAFVAWAIGRELDPDNNVSASIAAVVAGLAATAGRPSLVLAFGVLLGVRLIVGSVGVAMGRFDVIAVVLLGAVLGLSWESVVAVPLLMAGIMIGGGLRHSGWVATAALAASATALVVARPDVIWTRPSGSSVVLLLLAALVAVALIRDPQTPQCLPDCGRGQISRERLIFARLAAAGSIVGALAVGGGAGPLAAGTVVAACVGVAAAGLMSRTGDAAIAGSVRS